MPFVCKNPNGTCKGKISPQDTRNVYDNAKRCTVCGMYVELYHKRCPCCGAPLRNTSIRNRKHDGVF